MPQTAWRITLIELVLVTALLHFILVLVLILVLGEKKADSISCPWAHLRLMKEEMC